MNFSDLKYAFSPSKATVEVMSAPGPCHVHHPSPGAVESENGSVSGTGKAPLVDQIEPNWDPSMMNSVNAHSKEKMAGSSFVKTEVKQENKAELAQQVLPRCDHVAGIHETLSDSSRDATASRPVAGTILQEVSQVSGPVERGIVQAKSFSSLALRDFD